MNERKMKEPMVLCLCRRCLNDFRENEDSIIKRVDPNQIEQDTCTFCGQRRGYDYIITDKA